jgi:signal transduction histidine kinase
LKKISHSSALKILGIIALSLIICLVATLLMGVMKFSNYISFKDIINNNRAYEETDLINDEYTSIINNIGALLYYKDKDNIEILSREEAQEELEMFQDDEDALTLDELTNNLIELNTHNFNYSLKKLNSMDYMYFYATDGDAEFSNSNRSSKSDFEKFNSYLLLNDIEEIGDFHENRYMLNYEASQLISVNQFDIKIYMAFTDEYFETQQTEYKNTTQLINKILKITLLLILFSILLIIYLISITGKKYNSNKIHFNFIDKLYTDINILICIVLALFYLTLVYNYYDSDIISTTFKYENWFNDIFNILILINILITLVFICLVLSLIKHLKAGSLLKHSLSYKIVKHLTKFIREIINNGPLYVFIPSVLVFSSFVTIFFHNLFLNSFGIVKIFSLIIILITIIFLVAFSTLFFKQLDFIKKEIKNIRNGDLENKIPTNKATLFSSIAFDLNQIKSGQRIIISKEIKSERMKTELITNVSHDLKTPLTSIVNYVDLLGNENLKPEEANDYVKVLKIKVTKLKNLTKDLFEIASIQDGKININKSNIDIVLLLKQSFAEHEKQLSELKLDVIFNFKVENNIIKNDGKLLSRVFDNLILNIIKYSMQNTRIYIDVIETDNNLSIEFKNISNYKMNFNSEDITERFTRGDKSRSTEGNGLGLAIARSYVEELGGNFKIKVDGDLFKASITI